MRVIYIQRIIHDVFLRKEAFNKMFGLKHFSYSKIENKQYF